MTLSAPLDLKWASPMPRFAYLGAKVASCAAFGLIITVVLVLLGGFTVLMLAAAWITFQRSEANN